VALFADADVWAVLQTVVGAVAIVIGLAAIRYGRQIAIDVHHLQQRADKESAEQRRLYLLESLLWSLMSNYNRLEEIAVAVDAQVVYTNVDLAVLDATAALKYEVLCDTYVCVAIDRACDALRRVHAQVEQLLRVDHDGAARVSNLPREDGTTVTAHRHLRAGLVQAIKSNIEAVKAACGVSALYAAFQGMQRREAAGQVAVPTGQAA
jgi:hypothetical protein